MNNFDRQCYKKESQLPLSKRLAQEFITSPLLGRDVHPAKKSKNIGKSLDVNFLFDNEKPKLKTRRTEKLRKVINLSDAIRKQVVRINENKLASRGQAKKTPTERASEWAGKLNKTTISYFVEVETNSTAGSAKSPRASQSTIATARSVREDGGEEDTGEGEASSELSNSQKEFNILSFEKRQSELPVEEPPSIQSLRKMSSHVRLKGQELKQLYEKSSEKKSSKDSVTSTKKVVSGTSLQKTLSKLGAPLMRQLSELDLNLAGEGVSDLSMVMSLLESYHDLPDAAKLSACMYPGWELGQHCHSVAASVLSKGFPEPCLSSSSSSDDIFESTKYSREIIEEKLRGLWFEKKEDEEKSGEVKLEKQKKKVKSKTKSKCKCRDKKKHHSTCSRKMMSKTDKKFIVPVPSKDSEVSGYESQVESTALGPKGCAANSTSTVNVSDAWSQFQLAEDTKVKSGDSLGKSVKIRSEKSTSSEVVAKRPCNLETCLSLNKGTAAENDTENKKPSRPTGHDVRKCDQQRDDEKLKRERSELSERTHSGARLKSGMPSESSAFSMRTGVEYCAPETCEFVKNQVQQQNSDPSKLWKHSKSEYSRHSSKRREICSPKICKSSRSRSKKRFSPKARKGKLKERIGNRRWKREQRHFICDCHNIYIDDNGSDTDDLWSDKGLKRSRNRRYSLTFENVKKRDAMKCGGYVAEGHNCNCYSCYIKEKPWKRFLKRPNAVLHIPYPLTAKTLKERAQNTNSLLKKLRNKYNWSEENLKNYCTKHEVCKKPNLRKSLLQENPFTWEWRWCHKNKVDKKVKKQAPKEEKPGKFGYYVNIKEERLTRGEHFTSIQKIIEKVVYCKWNQDVAEMKLNHFLENMPKQQTCYSEGKTFDPDRRTCYNPKLIERLTDIVKFNDDPDRRIHEFSFPPKLLKYQEPQLVGDIGTDMPEIRPVFESTKFPTIYRDLFKDRKCELRKLMDTLLPPLQWTDEAGLWEMKVSIEPDNEETNKDMLKYLDYNETLCHAINRNFCAGRYRLYFEVFAEVIRQELFDYPERAVLLARIREDFLLTMLLYDGGLEMTLVSTTHLWKDIEADTIEIIEKETLEKEIDDIKGQIKGVMTATYDLEKQAEEQSQTKDYQNKDQEKLYKKTNHQLAAQFENIKAGLLYDLD